MGGQGPRPDPFCFRPFQAGPFWFLPVSPRLGGWGAGQGPGRAGPFWFLPVSPGLGGDQGGGWGGGTYIFFTKYGFSIVSEVDHVQQPNPKVEHVYSLKVFQFCTQIGFGLKWNEVCQFG